MPPKQRSVDQRVAQGSQKARVGVASVQLLCKSLTPYLHRNGHSAWAMICCTILPLLFLLFLLPNSQRRQAFVFLPVIEARLFVAFQAAGRGTANEIGSVATKG